MWFSTCAREKPVFAVRENRRGALNELAVESGCNKVALGHHFDDVIETFYMSLIYEARLSCFDAKSYLDRVGVTVIRPLIYIEEKDIINFAEREKAADNSQSVPGGRIYKAAVCEKSVCRFGTRQSRC